MSIEEMYLNIIQFLYDKPTGNTTFNDKNLRSGINEGCLFSLPLFNTVFEVLLLLPLLSRFSRVRLYATP